VSQRRGAARTLQPIIWQSNNPLRGDLNALDEIRQVFDESARFDYHTLRHSPNLPLPISIDDGP
jgi:hypothetical protein